MSPSTFTLDPSSKHWVYWAKEAINGQNGQSPKWEEVPSRMDALLDMEPRGWDEIRSWHIAFEGCHPFRDGNGRTGRILMNWQRIKQGLSLLIIHEGKEQWEYYKWFE